MDEEQALLVIQSALGLARDYYNTLLMDKMIRDPAFRNESGFDCLCMAIDRVMSRIEAIEDEHEENETMSDIEAETDEYPTKEYWVQSEFPSEIREMWFHDWHSVMDYANELKSRGGLTRFKIVAMVPEQLMEVDGEENLKDIDQKISDPIFVKGIYDKEKNAYGKRRESQTFFLKGEYYWADLNTFRDLDTECMIYKANKNGEVTNWTEVYCRRNIDVTRENLLKCIDEFKTELEENKWVENSELNCSILQ